MLENDPDVKRREIEFTLGQTSLTEYISVTRLICDRKIFEIERIKTGSIRVEGIL